MVKLPAVELQADDGKHEDGKEQEEADLEQRNHGLHDGLEHNLQALKQSHSKGHTVQEHLHGAETKSLHRQNHLLAQSHCLNVNSKGVCVSLSMKSSFSWKNFGC